MNSCVCGNQLEVVSDPDFTFDSPVAGKLLVPEVRFEFCSNCQERFLTPEEAHKISEFVKKQETETIASLPIGQFVSLVEAAKLLGLSKQALSKKSETRLRIILNFRLGNSLFFHRKSIELFRQKGDGRFLVSGKTAVEASVNLLEPKAASPNFTKNRTQPPVSTPPSITASWASCEPLMLH